MSAPLLEALGPIPDTLVTLDFETYYGKDYTLSSMTTEAYVRDPRFETIGVGVKVNDGPSVWMSDEGFRAWAAEIDWANVAVLAHHAHFDGLILSHHYGILPGFWFDTMSMGRAIHGPVQGVALAKLAIKYQVGEKGFEVDNAKGKRLADFSEEEWFRYGGYCQNDVELTHRLLFAMAEGFPDLELWNIDTTIRCFTEPKLITDTPVLEVAYAEEVKRKAALLDRMQVDKKTLSSNEKFAALLESLGVEAPVKPSPKQKNEDGTPKDIFAFAASDEGMQALLEHERDDIRWLAEARVAVKSTIIETRTERLLNVGKRGPVPVYYKFSGCHTHRLSGGDKMNFQNFNRGGALRRSILAPGAP